LTPEEKYELFEKYDFSKTGLLKRSAIDQENPKSELYHDIAGIIQALVIKLAEISQETVQDIEAYDILQDEIYKCYGWLVLKYQGISWNELDAQDPDLSVFFKMKRSIDGLGHSINSFLDNSRTKLGGSADSKEYKYIEKQIQRIGRLMQQYRQTKEKLRTQVPGVR
jgi:hypothetical protein